eukprot:TRINITY_DN14266_c0_g1_i1.p1 TRINITY_DN14266_c0_g1~~TRINITY_DN14266_c0_g1_i1.p1  ORF type:complete len:107 (-),score=28.72 TRINITY_DN14266_c0_g1_i1:10-330(-)
MCIRDRSCMMKGPVVQQVDDAVKQWDSHQQRKQEEQPLVNQLQRLQARVNQLEREKADWQSTQAAGCLLYTSDAADEEDSVDLGGCRIFPKTHTSHPVHSPSPNPT